MKIAASAWGDFFTKRGSVQNIRPRERRRREGKFFGSPLPSKKDVTLKRPGLAPRIYGEKKKREGEGGEGGLERLAGLTVRFCAQEKKRRERLDIHAAPKIVARSSRER